MGSQNTTSFTAALITALAVTMTQYFELGSEVSVVAATFLVGVVTHYLPEDIKQSVYNLWPR